MKRSGMSAGSHLAAKRNGAPAEWSVSVLRVAHNAVNVRNLEFFFNQLWSLYHISLKIARAFRSFFQSTSLISS